MADKRMFSKTIVGSDAFTEMPLSTQALYFHLGMYADDDGFINSPRKIQRMVGASEDDLKLLIAKRFLIPFESGVVVIKHWKVNNLIRSDRYKPTVYSEEKAFLIEKDNKSYTLKPLGIPNGYQTDTQVSIGKDRLGKDRLYSSAIPTKEEVEKYIAAKGLKYAKDFYDYYNTSGWKTKDGQPIDNWKRAIERWNEREKKFRQTKQTQSKFSQGILTHDYDCDALEKRLMQNMARS